MTATSEVKVSAQSGKKQAKNSAPDASSPVDASDSDGLVGLANLELTSSGVSSRSTSEGLDHDELSTEPSDAGFALQESDNGNESEVLIYAALQKKRLASGAKSHASAPSVPLAIPTTTKRSTAQVRAQDFSSTS